MRIGRYRITSRGYLVFGVLGILVISLLVVGLSHLWTGDLKATDPKSGVEQTATGGPSGKNETDQTTTGKSETSTDANQQTASQGTGNATESEMSLKDKNDVLGQINVVVYFGPDEYDLDSSFYPSLDSVVDTSVRFKEAHILIEGHFNGVPQLKTTPFRTQLSQNRAEVVQAYLVSQGVSPDRIEVVNMGSSKPVNKDESWQEIEKNRRVEVKFKALSESVK